MYYLKLEVQEIHRKKNATTGRLEYLTIRASNKETQVKIDCPVTFVGTYKNDNIIKLSEKLSVGKKIDLIEGEQGWGVNLNPGNKKYYSKDCYFMPDEFGVWIKEII